ncbi:hypothetical protein ACMD2_12201 [Ananas comosus]|uniref:Uncharacterized protein n=1 Tax=Ananas comosus TaxID=4615 RepID=A0A199V809_ANACO|nr:hypothetical protein ACMD2_12201 [Ananas comosus]
MTMAADCTSSRQSLSLLGSTCESPGTAPLKRKSEVRLRRTSSGVTPSTVRAVGSAWWSRSTATMSGSTISAATWSGVFPAGRRAVDVGGAELEERLRDLAAAVLDGVVQRQRLVEVEPLPHHHQLHELHVRRVQRPPHAAHLVVVLVGGVEVDGGPREGGDEGGGRRRGGSCGAPTLVLVLVVVLVVVVVAEGGAEAELFDPGDDVDGEVLREDFGGRPDLATRCEQAAHSWCSSCFRDASSTFITSSIDAFSTIAASCFCTTTTTAAAATTATATI